METHKTSMCSKIDYDYKQKPGETMCYKSIYLKDEEDLIENSQSGINTLKQMFLQTIDQNADHEFLGTRRQIVNRHSKYEYREYQWKTYSQVYQESYSLAKFIIHYSLYNENKCEGKSCRCWGYLGRIVSNGSKLILHDG